MSSNGLSGKIHCHILRREMAFLPCASSSNVFSHLEQAYGFSPVWILTCIFRMSLTKCMFTFESEKRLLFYMDPLMYLHFTPCFKCLVTFGAIKWIISFVGSVMFLQLYTVWSFHVFLSSVMCLQMGSLA